MFKTLVDIIASPTAAFTAIREKPAVLLPMLLVIGSVVSIQVGYLLNVDYGFFVDQTVETVLRNNPDAPENAIRANYENLNATTLAGISAGSTAVVLLVITALTAVYLNLMAKLSYAEIGFRRWFALCWWTAVPAVFIALAAWVVILTADNGQIRQEDLGPLSLNALLFQTSGPWATLLGNVNVVTLWSAALLVLGYQNWTQGGMLKSAVIALIPTALIYGIWAFTIAF